MLRRRLLVVVVLLLVLAVCARDSRAEGRLPESAPLVWAGRSGIGWLVRLDLDTDDATTFAAFTAQVSPNPAPRNELAIIFDDRPGGALLYAPLVDRRLTGPVDLGAGSRAEAMAWLDRIRR